MKYNWWQHKEVKEWCANFLSAEIIHKGKMFLRNVWNVRAAPKTREAVDGLIKYVVGV